MQPKLTPIIKLRAKLFEKQLPEFYAEYKIKIEKSSLVAQEYYFSGNYHIDRKEPFYMYRVSGFESYKKAHKKYALVINNFNDENYVFGLSAADLCIAFDKDVENNIIDNKGNIITEESLHKSTVLNTQYIIQEQINEKFLNVPKDILISDYLNISTVKTK